MIRIHDDLWEYVETKDGKPVCDNTKKQQKALARVCMSMNPVAITHVRNATTAWEAWRNLQKTYEDTGLEDEYLTVIMLSGLTQDYDPLIMALENCNVKCRASWSNRSFCRKNSAGPTEQTQVMVP